MKRVLVVEDENSIREMEVLNLRMAGWEVLEAPSAERALELLHANPPCDAALLDLMLPGMDGLSLCETIRRDDPDIGIIIVSAKGQETDKIRGLSIGADDYITKPFNPLELVARVKGQLRRYIRYNSAGTGTPASAEPEEYDLHGLTIDKNAHKCTLYGKEVALTPLEFSILWYLCSHHGRVVSSEELFEAVWGEKYLDSNNTVMSHIARLREKLGEAPRRPKFIKTVWGVGYTVE